MTEKDAGPSSSAGGLDPGEIPDDDRPEDIQAQKGNDDGAAIAELIRRFGNVEKQLGDFHQRSAHRELVIDRLHEDNQQLRSGISRMVLEPVIADLIRLHDQLDREVRRFEADGQDERLLRSFAEDVLQILDRCGIDVFSAELGDPFERGRHRALAVVVCHEESWHNTVAEVVAAGFVERDTGRIRRPVQALFHQYSPDREDAGPSADVTHSQ